MENVSVNENKNLKKKIYVNESKIIKDETFNSSYKKAIDILFTKTKVNEPEGEYPGFDKKDVLLKTITPNKEVFTTHLKNIKNIGYKLEYFALRGAIPNTKSINDEFAKLNYPRTLHILSASVYEGVFIKFIYKIPSEICLSYSISPVFDKTKKNIIFKFIKNKKNELGIISKIKELSSLVNADQIVMNRKTANKLRFSKEVTNILKTFYLAIDENEYGEIFSNILLRKVIILEDPKDILKDKIIIMHKGDEYALDTALRAFVYHDPEVNFFSGEQALVHAYDYAQDEGVHGNPNKENIRVNCYFRFYVGLQIVNKDLIRVLDISSF